MHDIESFKSAVESDPLFAAEGMDIERAERNLAQVLDALSELERAFSASSLMRRAFLWRYRLKRHAIPSAFLYSFIACERARREFISDPSILNAEHLLHSWRKTARRYVRDLKRYRALHDVLRAAEPKGDEFQFQDMFGNVSDIDYIEQTLDSMEENGAALIAEVATYERILSGEVGKKEVVSDANEAALSYASGVLSLRSEKFHALQLKERMPFNYSDILESYGPMLYTLRHFDGAPTPHMFKVYILRNRRTGIENVHVALIDEYYFLKIIGPDADFGGLGRANFEELIEREIPYWHQSSTVFYTMRDQLYWADLTTIADMRRRPELNKRLVMKERSSMFDLMLGSCALDIRGYTGHTWDRSHKQAFDTYSFLYGLLMRSHPSIYYLPFNGSVWRLPKTLDILGDRRLPAEKIRYRPLSEILPKVGETMMETIMSGARIRAEAREKKGIMKI